jgi:hypothetical protein
MLRTMLCALALLAWGCADSDFSGAAGQRTSIDAHGGDASDAGDADDDDNDTNGNDGATGADGDEGDGKLQDDDGSAGGGIDSDNDSADGGDDDIMTAEDLAKLPGVEVVKVGVNFEDSGLQGDRDHNDAVLCFEGKFKVDYPKGDVVSTKKQTVVASTYSSAACQLAVRVEVVHSDGSKEDPIGFPANWGQQVTLNFKKGSKLEVYMTSVSGCHQGVEKNMHSNVDAKVEPDFCRQ